ncbi:hypothetical protein NDU88_004179 [Pleurodeles waltl]|uniref:Carboxymuconolactone decarboxylase-like domain-containing protein n=1 Tax=Pleurodeles waltl TaxID=8319 RepID=A0AAV7KZK6_PLEWA|nr:hypothetical protein NDU88_004179 [Pleurodeles waltl]
MAGESTCLHGFWACKETRVLEMLDGVSTCEFSAYWGARLLGSGPEAVQLAVRISLAAGLTRREKIERQVEYLLDVSFDVVRALTLLGVGLGGSMTEFGFEGIRSMAAFPGESAVQSGI